MVLKSTLSKKLVSFAISKKLKASPGRKFANLYMAYIREIAEYVPSRSINTLSVNYKYIKALIETFSREEVTS